MNLIVAVSKNWGIGNRGNLLFRLKEDMKFFRRMTMGKILIMGRKTLDSLPGGKPLPDRVTVVLTRSRGFSGADVQVVHDTDELLALIREDSENAFVCGGEQIYRLLLPFCRLAYVTEIDEVKAADTFFPDLSQMPEWKRIRESDPVKEDGITYRFCIWENQALTSL